LVVEIIQIATARLMLLPEETLNDSAEIFRFVISSWEDSSSAIRVVVDLVFSLYNRRYVLNLEAILSKVEVIRGVEAAATVNALVRDEIREAPEDVAANFALINQVTLSRQQFTQLRNKEKSIFGMENGRLSRCITHFISAGLVGPKHFFKPSHRGCDGLADEAQVEIRRMLVALVALCFIVGMTFLCLRFIHA
jgi:hypothetical protein